MYAQRLMSVNSEVVMREVHRLGGAPKGEACRGRHTAAFGISATIGDEFLRDSSLVKSREGVMTEIMKSKSE
jgi:hypothetical protein